MNNVNDLKYVGIYTRRLSSNLIKRGHIPSISL